ncbi:MAG: hypothetical protein C5B56_14015 [Proteobacteria bacterium]|nr:MAG: hypothetical protein C5B56_14015 [Pseudomonadota bacterium]
MPRYFFNMVEGQGKKVVRDSEGTVLPSVRAAKKEALGLARDVAGHGLRGLTQTWKVVVTDEHGEAVLTVALSDVRAARLRAWLGTGSRLANPSSTFTHRMLVVALAGAILALAMGIRTTVVVNEPAGGFQTAAALAEDIVIAVRFNPSARMAEINELLTAYKAAIIDGPRSGGFYRLRIADAASSQQELADVASRMAREPVVDFAAVTQ